MTKLKKEDVLQQFTEAYRQAEGKAPDIAEKSGWYSVNGGKNMRLKNLAAWAEELNGGATTTTSSTTKSSTSAPKSKTATKSKTTKAAGTTKPKKAAQPKRSQPTTNAGYTVKASSDGQTAQELWRQRLQEQEGQCRLPRGLN